MVEQERREQAVLIGDLIFRVAYNDVHLVMRALRSQDRNYLADLIDSLWDGGLTGITYLARHPRSLALVEDIVLLLVQLQDRPIKYEGNYFSRQNRSPR